MLSPDDVQAVVVHSDLTRTGWFECSEPLVNHSSPTPCRWPGRSAWLYPITMGATTCATFLLLTGASPRTVMETLGHSQIALTMNTYAHVLPQVERDAVDQAARALFGEPRLYFLAVRPVETLPLCSVSPCQTG